MMAKILLTGATGMLGTELASMLARRAETATYALVRAADEEEAFHRLRGAWYHDKDLYNAIGKTIMPVAGDFTKPGLGLCDKDREVLLSSVTHVIHAGAQIGFQQSKEELRRTNWKGTENVLALAEQMPQLVRFVHISTAYVAGQKSGRVMEEEPVATSFSSLYEKTKADAEDLVRVSGLPYSICRPGMIVGDTKTGWVRNFNTIYYIMKLFLLGGFLSLPISADTPLNLVPGDYVASSVITVCFSEKAAGRTFHLTCPREMAPIAGELTTYVRTWAKVHLGITLPKTAFIPVPALKRAGLAYNQKEEDRKKGLATNLLTLLPYFFAAQDFDRTNTDEVCGRYALRWQTYIDPLLAFACRKNFMRQTGRTVFEQAMERRESRRYPVDCFDVTEEGIKKTTGKEVNARIEQARDALYAWGIRKGDRIALTGINSVAYLVLEQALGLLGAVSVPIYYTTPAEEASLLLEKSGAAWFFIGDTRIMEQAESLHTNARLVSFSAAEQIRKDGVMRWAAFLEKADGPAPRQYPDPEDLATIRYTSGTTGDPKGVMFNFGQLAWMGEVLTNLLPWKDRNRTMRYLSFLPLSHVVEGILASYAPYYALCRVEYYYLNDFGALTEALPKVRPNVFFSVPRFYEKVWEQASSNKLGKAWLAAREGPKKKAMAAVLKQAVLRKAGLDRCGQLIVGSAPVSESLLLRFREMGIEIHNAYGQTEAPLITINRLGDNVIPTIGTPLPETTVTAEPDGELIVTGPQVALGYYGLKTQTIQDGVLRTGDLGTIHENGHITLHGRKKEFIVTAYGKNISIPKLEEKLKDIQGVNEAVLIGENRPYCTALLWTDGEVPDLAAGIEEMNKGVSHPEQIRAFRVIEKPLSIKDGELTPNLKVRRANVMDHYAAVIEEMYK